MNQVSMKEARKRLGVLVQAAERGETVTITRRGRKVARLVPAAKKSIKGLPDLTGFRASLKVGGRSLTEELLAQRKEERY
jgi:prevent-host-death family protein